MAAEPPDRTEEGQRRRELDVMRELEEQSGRPLPAEQRSAAVPAPEEDGGEHRLQDDPRAR